ncbi:ABC transporter permease subunit [Kallotenue papyrolyticum]|uniref:ABC transporter permease subunit n=1 Tax=Kallotenue papyrolyticum TaxID=1325125 RepID=UPI000492DECB
MGQGLFAALALTMTLLILFVTPALTAGAISGEHEQLTYDLLVATPLPPGRILSGKLVAALWYVLLLLFAAVPLGSVILLFGGLAPHDLLRALALLLLTALAAGMLGLLCSALSRRTLRATILAYLLIMLVIMGAYFVAMLRASTAQPGPPITSHALAASPLSAMTSVVLRGAQPAGDQPVVNAPSMTVDSNLLMNMPPFSTLTYGLVDYNKPIGPTVLPVYRYAYVGYALFSIVCYWLAGHLVLPRRRWRLGWHDLRMALLLLGVAALGAWYLDLWAAPVGVG